MEEILDLSYEAVVRYFTTLQQFGYKNYGEVDKLLALVGIQELTDMCSDFITEQDFKYIMQAVNCLSGTTCLIDFPTYPEGLSMIHKSKVNYLTRLGEDTLIRMDMDLIKVME